jgi:hypothetical protein
MKEAAKLGFGRALAPSGAVDTPAFRVTGITRLMEAVRRIGEDAWT